jgi:hypothetical protein
MSVAAELWLRLEMIKILSQRPRKAWLRSSERAPTPSGKPKDARRDGQRNTGIVRAISTFASEHTSFGGKRDALTVRLTVIGGGSVPLKRCD